MCVLYSVNILGIYIYKAIEKPASNFTQTFHLSWDLFSTLSVAYRLSLSHGLYMRDPGTNSCSSLGLLEKTRNDSHDLAGTTRTTLLILCIWICSACCRLNLARPSISMEVQMLV